MTEQYCINCEEKMPCITVNLLARATEICLKEENRGDE